MFNSNSLSLYKKKQCESTAFTMAERQGFEPWVRITAHMISNHAPSAARTPLHVFCCVTGTCIVYEKVRFMSRKNRKIIVVS